MASIGEHLKQLRESKGWSLEEFSKISKISSRFLDSLESQKFKSLPGGVFNRGFIKVYAKYCGGDETELLAEYEEAVREQRGPEVNLLSGATPTPDQSSSRKQIYLFLISVVILAALAIVYFVYRSSRRTSMRQDSAESESFESTAPASSPAPAQSSQPSSETQASSIPPVLPPPPSSAETTASAPGAAAGGPQPSAPGESANATKAAAQPNPKMSASASKSAAMKTGELKPAKLNASASPVAPAKSSEAENPAVSTPANPLNLRIVAKEQTWLSIKKDGKEIYRKILMPNESLNYSAKNKFDIVCGNAAGVTFILNGKTLPALGGEREVKAVTFNRPSTDNAKQTP